MPCPTLSLACIYKKEVVDTIRAHLEGLGFKLAVTLKGGKDGSVNVGLNHLHALVPVASVLPTPKIFLQLKQGLPVCIHIRSEDEGELKLSVYEEDKYTQRKGPLMIQALLRKICIALKIRPT